LRPDQGVASLIRFRKHWHIVKILPCRTQENVIDGVVITFIDISVAKKFEAELRAAKGAGLAA
jgi:two-component system CheB/CheR fusion protein